MDTNSWLSDTRRVVIVGKAGLAVGIKKDISDALDIKQGDLVEIRIRTTGFVAKPDTRKKQEQNEDPIRIEP